MAIPKLALIPSGVKAGKLYSVLPTNGDGDFTTTRNTVATRVNENGLIEEVASNVPRLDYSDGTCPSLLLEPTATNLITYSEDFSNAAWIKDNVSVVSGQVSPKGDTSAFKLVEDTSTSQHYQKTGNITITTSTDYSISVFAKDNGSKFAIRDGSSDSYISVDLSTGTILDSSGTDAKIKSLSNGWYKVSLSYLSTSTICAVQLMTLSSSYVSGTPWVAYTGDGTSGVYIYGAQLEENSSATSLINTVGTTQTRVADTASGSGNSTVINSSEGVLYAEISGFENDTSFRTISLSDGTVSNQIQLLYSGDTNVIRVILDSNSIGQVDFNYTMTNGTNYNKIAFSYKQNEFNLWVNGVKRQSDPSGNTPINLNDFSFQNGAGSANFYGKTKSVQVYTTALSDAELTTLTTI